MIIIGNLQQLLLRQVLIIHKEMEVELLLDYINQHQKDKMQVPQYYCLRFHYLIFKIDIILIFKGFI